MTPHDNPTPNRSNRLINSNSPYLLSHAHNPVDWFPWGNEALEKSKAEDKPIFLSIGYAACHWCHVMERESFENPDIAAILNEHFVPIKVDREERPDLDHIYMTFTQAMTGHGGWPMSVFLTPDLKPFFAGTYFPPEDGYGQPGFKRLITELGRGYREQRLQIGESSREIFKEVEKHLEHSAPPILLTKTIIDSAVRAHMRNVDDLHGGFGLQPKFPHPLELSLLLLRYRQTKDTTYLHTVTLSLDSMARGGIYDQLGGGFARYSTDRQWLVPHFEKMLYDNSQLISTYADAWRITKDELYRSIVRETLDWMLREMRSPEGGFYSSLDADSEGEEGKFYVWTIDEIRTVLDTESAELIIKYYNATPTGNFEHQNIFFVNVQSDLVKSEIGESFDTKLHIAKKKLLTVRDKRIRPLTDDKILTSWNGMAIRALCEGYRITGDERYLQAAKDAANFIRTNCFKNGVLTHSWREGRHTDGEFLEDYAFFIAALIGLYQVDTIENHANNTWLQFGKELAIRAIEQFQSADGTFYLRPTGETDLILRPKEETDSAIPSAGSIMIANLLKLHRLTEEQRFLESARNGLQKLSGILASYPSALTAAVLAVDYYLGDKPEIALVGNSSERNAMLKEIHSRYLPHLLVASSVDGSDSFPLFQGRAGSPNEITAHYCLNSVCNQPVKTAAALAALLDSAR